MSECTHLAYISMAGTVLHSNNEINSFHTFQIRWPVSNLVQQKYKKKTTDNRSKAVSKHLSDLCKDRDEAYSAV